MTSTQLDFYQEHTQSLMTPSMRKAVDALRLGQPVLLLDAQDRENEGDLVVAAEKIDALSMNFLIQHGSGIVCLALKQARLDQLGVGPMVPHNTNLFNTAFSVSIEARHGVSTGVSAKDRTTTVKTAIADETRPSDLARPGHVFPLACVEKGVFERMGHTEGSVDLAIIANLNAAAVLCDLMNTDGSMALGPEREAFARMHKIPVISIEEILFHRIKTENILEHCEKNLGTLTWHRFCFWGEDFIDIFMRSKPLETKAHRLEITTNENLDKRFLACLLGGREDDPLAGALTSLEKNNVDIVALIKYPDRKIEAALCRALLALDIKNIIAQENFAAMASDYFGIACA